MCQGSGFLFVFYWPHWQLQYTSWGVVEQFLVSIVVNIVSGKRLNYLFPIRSIKLLISRVIIGNNAPSSFKAWARSLWRVSLDRWDPFWRTCGENNAMWWNIQLLCWVNVKTNYSMWDEVTRLTRDTCHEFFSLVFFSFFFIFILFKVHLWDLPRVLLPRELDAVHLQPKIALSILHTVVEISLSILVNTCQYFFLS